MTNKTTALTQVREDLERFPDFPPRDDMQNWFYLHESAVGSALAIHLPNAIVVSEVPVTPSRPRGSDVRIPDLLVAFDSDLALLREQNGYVIDSQGKAPDFVLEVASRSTGEVDYTDKREVYERFGVGEYWRFDPSGGEYHDAAPAGDRLMDGVYEPIEIEALGEGRLRGYSEALRLYVCWEEGMLRFFDPVTESYLRSHEEAVGLVDEERAGRLAAESRAGAAEARAQEEAAARGTAEARAGEEEAARLAAQARAEEERAARLAAESRLAEFEAELRRLRGE